MPLKFGAPADARLAAPTAWNAAAELSVVLTSGGGARGGESVRWFSVEDEQIPKVNSATTLRCTTCASRGGGGRGRGMWPIVLYLKALLFFCQCQFDAASALACALCVGRGAWLRVRVRVCSRRAAGAWRATACARRAKNPSPCAAQQGYYDEGRRRCRTFYGVSSLCMQVRGCQYALPGMPACISGCANERVPATLGQMHI